MASVQSANLVAMIDQKNIWDLPWLAIILRDSVACSGTTERSHQFNGRPESAPFNDADQEKRS